MKKKFSILSIFIFQACFGLPVKNPSDPFLLSKSIFWEDSFDQLYEHNDICCFDWSNISLRLGYYGNYIFDRKLKSCSDVSFGYIEDTRIYTNAGLVVVNFWDLADLYCNLGATNINLQSNANIFSIDLGFDQLEILTTSEFSWNIGLLTTIFEWDAISVGLNAQYFFTNPNIKKIIVGKSISTDPDSLELEYHEWQVSLALGYRINHFIPYFALSYAAVNAQFNGLPFILNDDLFDITDRRLKESENWGYAIGVTLVELERIDLNIEGHFGDEKAIGLNAQIRF